MEPRTIVLSFEAVSQSSRPGKRHCEIRRPFAPRNQAVAAPGCPGSFGGVWLTSQSSANPSRGRFPVIREKNREFRKIASQSRKWVRISKQIRSVTANFPAQRNRELLLLEQGILNNGTGNVFAQSGNRCRSTPIALASCRKTSLQADAGGPIAIPESASSRFWQGRWPSRCLGIAASCHAERIRRSRQSLAGSPLSNSRYASKLVSDVTTVRFTPFWPKLRLSMSIGKTSKHSGNRRPADVSDGAHRAGAVPGRPFA
jgi:hypothetical protein